MNISILLKISWKSVDKQFGQSLAAFRQHRKSVDKEAETSHLIEEGKARDVESEILSLIQKQQTGPIATGYYAIYADITTEENRIRLLSMLSNIRWERHHAKALRAKHPRAGTWIFDSDSFKQWHQESKSCSLYVHGTRKCIFKAYPISI